MRILSRAMLAGMLVALVAACEPFQTADGERISASQLAAPPEQGPQIFGPFDEDAKAAPAVRQGSMGSSGNSARISRSKSSGSATRSATPSVTSSPATSSATSLTTPSTTSSAIAAAPPAPRADEAGFVTTPSGLRYKDLSPGQGDLPQTGQTVLAHYSGWIYEDGQKGDLFDRSRGNPFDFVLGTGQVIRGWDEAFANMRPGAKRILIIPPDLAYGRSGAPGLIPPNATLWFEVEFVGTR